MRDLHCEMVKEALPPGGPLQEVVDVPLERVLHSLLGLALDPGGLQRHLVVPGVWKMYLEWTKCKITKV